MLSYLLFSYLLLFSKLFFLEGTFAPGFLASDKAMAMACLREVTFLPLPLFSVPRFFRA